MYKKKQKTTPYQWL